MRTILVTLTIFQSQNSITIKENFLKNIYFIKIISKTCIFLSAPVQILYGYLWFKYMD